jgi:hypothetical protein
MSTRHTATAILATSILAATWIFANADAPKPADQVPTLLDRIEALEARVAKLEKDHTRGVVMTVERPELSPGSRAILSAPTRRLMPQGEVNGMPYYHMLLGDP